MIRKIADPIIEKVSMPAVILLNRFNVHPNVLTILGVILSSFGGFYVAMGKIKTGAVILIFTNLFDVLDGTLAKYSKKVTKFGGFLDSVMDRYTEGIIFIALTYYYLCQGKTLMLVLTLVALVGSYAVSYSRARAENVIRSCQVGVGSRVVRLATLGIFAFIDKLDTGIILVIIMAHFTVLQRIIHTYLELKKDEVSY